MIPIKDKYVCVCVCVCVRSVIVVLNEPAVKLL